MYHKIKNTLAGLGIAALFVAGGLLFSEPVPAGPHTVPGNAPAELAARSRAEALAVVLERGSRVRLQIAMPYYSFGGKLTPRQES